MCNCRKLISLSRRLYFRKGYVRNFSTKRETTGGKARLYGWGSCDSGELGEGYKTSDILSPVVLNFKQTELGSVSCGYATTFLTRKSQIGAIGLGLNTVGQLGTRESTNEITLDNVIRKLSCGRAHTLAVSHDGVFAAGSNIQGQCGLSKEYRFCKEFKEVPVPFDHKLIQQIACGLDHSLILTTDGRVYSTGLGADGQTGIGCYDCQYGFVQIAGDINDEKVTQISTSTDTCLALTDRCHVYGWGNNEQGQISWQNEEKQVSLPTRLEYFSGLQGINQIFAGGSFSAFIKNGDVYVTGYGALGLGMKVTEVHSYCKADYDGEFGKISKISGGPDYIAALTESGKLFTWGRGNHGRLGHGTTEDQFSPKMVSLPGPVLVFACGIDHMVAIIKSMDGTHCLDND